MKRITALSILAFCLVALFAAAASAAVPKQIIDRWEKKIKYIDREDLVSNLEIQATYYAAEYVEALVQSEADANLWTQQEADDYKYKLLKTLNLEEMIPIHIGFVNNGPTMHLGPFDVMAKLRIGSKEYKMVEYDKRFNFGFQGKKDGMVFFPRYDEKTGKDLLQGIKQVRLVFSSTISPVTDGRKTEFLWDIANDDPSKLFAGKAAAKLETERLIKRLEKLRGDKAEEEEKLKAIENEMTTIQQRLDELTKVM